MTNLAYQLLALFLVQNNLVVIAAIINNKIKFQKIGDAPTHNNHLSYDYSSLVDLPGFNMTGRGDDDVIIIMVLDELLDMMMMSWTCLI